MKSKLSLTRLQDNSILLYSIIWLHGLGDSSEGFLDWFQMPTSPVYEGARIRLLQAPKRKVTINGGNVGTSWYDMKILDPHKFGQLTDKDLFSLQEMEQSRAIVDKYVQMEASHWKQLSKTDPYKRVFVGGFSQGCAMSLYYGFQCSEPIGGIIGYSGHLFQSTPLKNLGKTPIILFHGLDDPLLREPISKLSYKKILQDKSVTYIPIPKLAHSVETSQMKTTKEWLSDKIPKQ